MVDVLHINDNNLVLLSAGQRSTSRGYAWLKDDQVLFDLSAVTASGDSAATASGEIVSPLSQCRLAPQQINNRYWQQCEQSAIPANGAGMRHAADLVWQHLKQLRQQNSLSDLVLVVPSHYRESNLQLLLGIAKACQLQVLGLLNKAVLALQNEAPLDGEYWHFDVQLHQTVCSRISVSDDLVKLGEIEILSDVGIHVMQEALLKGLQNNFIQNDRFDPLHDAATEQQLFDQLPSIAMQLAESGKASISLQHQSRLHTTTLDAKDWQALLSPFSDRLLKVGGSTDTSYIDLNAAFGSAGLDLLTQTGFIQIHEAVIVSLSQAGYVSDSGSIIYRTDLPVLTSNDDRLSKTKASPMSAGETLNHAAAELSEAPSIVNAAVQQATHILCSGKAMPIVNAQLNTDNGVLGLQQSTSGNIQELLNSGHLFILNDDGRTQLQTNDRIGSNLADGVLTVIQVL